MVATKTKQEVQTVDQREVPTVGPKVEAEDIELEERVILPWYRRVPAPGLTGLRHYPGYGKR